MAIEINPLMKRAKDISMMVPYWNKVESIVNGLDSMREKSTDFLPKFPKETDESYDFRLSQSKLTNVYRDVLEGLATKPFEEEVVLIGGAEIPEAAHEFVKNVDGSGNNLSVFSALTFFNGINYSIDWIFVDFPTTDPTVVMNVAEAKRLNLKPFWSHVLGKNVLEVKTKIIGSKEVLSYIRILEPDADMDSDYVRVFERSDEGIVSWQLFEREKNSSDFVMENSGILDIDEIPLVPFITGRRDGKSFRFFPVMQDAADLQITLYQNESGLEFIKTMTCYPMLAANGMKPAKDSNGNQLEVATGPMRVLYGVPDGAGNHGEWKFIEPSANSMEFLQKNIDKTKQDLRELGRQPLTALSTQLTTVTTSIAAGKARSAVSAWALGLKDALENALRITMLWMNVDYEPIVNVYTGFDNVSNDSTDLDQLGNARERGDLSRETYWSELKRRKVLSPEFNSEEELKRLLEEIPSDDGLDSPTISTSTVP